VHLVWHPQHTAGIAQRLGKRGPRNHDNSVILWLRTTRRGADAAACQTLQLHHSYPLACCQHCLHVRASRLYNVQALALPGAKTTDGEMPIQSDEVRRRRCRKARRLQLQLDVAAVIGPPRQGHGSQRSLATSSEQSCAESSEVMECQPGVVGHPRRCLGASRTHGEPLVSHR